MNPLKYPDTKYLRFMEIPTSNKTKRWSIRSLSSGDTLGTIKWYGAWRQYCFFPEGSTIWNKDCLSDIQQFLIKIKDERNEPPQGTPAEGRANFRTS